MNVTFTYNPVRKNKFCVHSIKFQEVNSWKSGKKPLKQKFTLSVVNTDRRQKECLSSIGGEKEGILFPRTRWVMKWHKYALLIGISSFWDVKSGVGNYLGWKAT